jgi:hypothetical protein
MAYNVQTKTIVPDEVSTDFNTYAGLGNGQAIPASTANSGTVSLNQTNNAIQASQPQSGLAITPQSLQQVTPIKIPSVQQPTASAAVIASTQPSIANADANFSQVKAASNSGADDAQTALNNLAASIYGQKATIQSGQADRENAAGLQEQQKALGEINTEIASQQLALRGEQEKVRTQYATEAQKQVSNNTLNDTYGRRLADLAIRQAAANTNITAIQSNAERQTKLMTAPLDTKIEYLTTFGKDNVNYLSSKEKEKLAFLVDDIKAQKAAIEALQNAKANAIAEVAKNGGGADQTVIKAIQDSKDITGVTSSASKYLGLIDREAKLADIAQSRAATDASWQNIAESKAKMIADQGGTVNVKSIISDPNVPPEQKNTAILTVLSGSKKVPPGTQTLIGNALQVINSAQTLATERQTSGFKGASPLNYIADKVFPDALKASSRVELEQYLEGINLKTQIWASGASLTAEQTKQVNRLTPKITDTQTAIRTKLNGLTNFMLDDARSRLQSAGVSFVPEKVDLFADYDQVNKLTKEEQDYINSK